MGTCRQCDSWWLGETPFVQVSMTWVQQRPCMTREIETWLSDSRSVTIVWLTTEADEILTVSTEVMSYCNCYCYYYTGKHSTHSQQQHQYFTKSAKQITPNRKLWLTKPNNKKNLCCYGTLQCYFLPYLAMWWIVAPYSRPTSKYNFWKSNTVQSHCFDRIHSDRPHRPTEALKFQNRQQAQGTSSSRRKLRLLVHLLAWQKPSQSKHKQLETQIISFCCTTDYELLRRLVETMSCDILQMTQWRTVVSGTWKYDDPRL